MRRRPSNSAAEDDDDNNEEEPSSAPASPPGGDERDGPPTARKPTTIATGATSEALDRRKADTGIQPGHSQIWKSLSPINGSPAKEQHAVISLPPQQAANTEMQHSARHRRSRMRSPWSCSPSTLLATALAAFLVLTTLHSFVSRQLDVKGCRMSYMRPAFAKFEDFDTEHTRFASKYSLYLYRESGIDEDTKVKGVPVLFIPGNAGSYKQVRPIAAEAAQYFHDSVQLNAEALKSGTRSLDFFTVDFNEDITAFHGQTMLDQAEYLNEAVAYILSLYHEDRRSMQDPDLPDPSSVILVGHSMGGIVARTMLTMPNYQSNSINTIITMSAPHARPPVSFDSEMVRTYKRINEYWRQAYSQKWANNNPLWHVTLISIAGGGLDTVVPSDYASLSSLVPDTHGFTVFTSSVPSVWTGMDHQAILWCDQFRKIIVRSLMDVVDVHRPGQTKPRADRMRIFKKWYLTGMEEVAEKTLPHQEPTTLLTLEDNSNSIIQEGTRFTLRSFGQAGKPKAYLLPAPPRGTAEGSKFTLLSNEKLDPPGHGGNLEVLFCSVFPLQAGQSATLFSMNMDLSGNSSGSTRLACKNAAEDVISLPASTRTSKYPFEEGSAFSYLQYDLEDISDHQFVAIIDKATNFTSGWVIAEFNDHGASVIEPSVGLGRLLTSGLRLRLPANRPMVTEIKIPAIHSSLLAYNLVIGNQACGEDSELFSPLLRQYLSDPYESKYFVNVKQAGINLHGVAPFMPPPLKAKSALDGVSLQLWSDSNCNTSMDVSLRIDVAGSMGKLVMRYMTVFAAFPLLVVALVLRKQFKVYDEQGVFVPFSEAMDLCLRKSLPILLLALSFLAISLANSSSHMSRPQSGPLPWRRNATETLTDYTKNDLLLGSQDSFFWFLVPTLGLVSVGGCVVLNYIALSVTYILSFLLSILTARPAWLQRDDRRRASSPAFAAPTPRRRIVTTFVILILVSTLIPYQFAYLVACIVQIATCTRALRVTRESRTGSHYNFYNYAHSILILMLWILPINLPVLVVWIHNLSVHWLTPFSSHHNVLSIMPFILLVETLTSGKMVPRITSRLSYITNTSLFLLAVYAAVYGVTYAYILHHLVNLVALWLVVLHFSSSSITLKGLSQMLEVDDGEADQGSSKKRP